MMRKLLILLGLFVVAGLAGCKKTPAQERTYYIERIVLDEAFSVTPQLIIVYDDQEKPASFAPLKTELNNVCRRLDEKFNPFQADTMLSRVNNGAGSVVAVDKEFILVLQAALAESDAAFAATGREIYDVSISPVWNAWGFKDNYYAPLEDNRKEAPQPAELAPLLPLVNWRDVEIDEAALTVKLRNSGMALDLGSIVKGYAADALEAVLVTAGFSRAIIDVGGNILLLGANVDRHGEDTGWKTKVRTPYVTYFDADYEKRNFIGYFYASDKSVVTSGAYERYLKNAAGEMFGHILDPKTGFPVVTDLASVTIVTKKSIDADALSTVVYGLGLEAGHEYVLSLPETEAIFITSDKKIYVTPNLASEFIYNSEINALGYQYKGAK